MRRTRTQYPDEAMPCDFRGVSCVLKGRIIWPTRRVCTTHHVWKTTKREVANGRRETGTDCTPG
jgi:hypothetical protein